MGTAKEIKFLSESRSFAKTLILVSEASPNIHRQGA